MSNNLRGTATLVWMTRALITRSLCDHATELLMFLLNRCSFNVKKHFYHFIFQYKIPPAQITMKLEPLDKRSRTVPVMKKQNSWEKLKHAAVQIMWEYDELQNQNRTVWFLHLIVSALLCYLILTVLHFAVCAAESIFLHKHILSTCHV